MMNPSPENHYPGFITKIENGSYMIQQVAYRDQLRELKKEELREMASM